MTRPLTSLTPGAPARWQSGPLLFEHRLQQMPEFDSSALEGLIQSYPREHYAIVHMGQQGADGRRVWREGEFAPMSGRQVLDAIAHGRLWLNLRNGGAVVPRFGELVRQIFAEAGALAAPLSSYDLHMGLLVSSPGAQVYYHADLPGQGLLQLQGSKRIYVYPPRKPFLTDQGLEDIALRQLEIGLHYEPAFDAAAEVFDLHPGQGLFWPLNSPHRIENHDCLNISMTLEYWTEQIRRRHMLNMANAILRHRFGYTARSRALAGPAFHAKAALQSLWRRSGRLDAMRRQARPVDFRLDPAHPGRIIDIAPAHVGAPPPG